MQTPILKYTVFALFLTILCGFTSVGEWELKKDKNGVQVYTRAKSGSTLKEFKGTALIKTSMEEIIGVLSDINSYTEWQHNCLKTYIVKENDDNEDVTVYVLTAAPWPVSDREVIIDNTIVRDADGSITMFMKASDKDVPPNEGIVRITYLEGFWKIEPKPDGVLVTNQVHTDPGGKIPDWLANSTVIDSPFNTLLNLKNLLEK